MLDNVEIVLIIEYLFVLTAITMRQSGLTGLLLRIKATCHSLPVNQIILACEMLLINIR